jgi:C-terminal processing protease CtpA/Prc
MQQRKDWLRLLLMLWMAAGTAAALTPAEKAKNLESFEVVWKTVRDRHPDARLNGLDWKAVHDATRPLIERAASMEEVRSVLTGMLAKLDASHYAIIPKERYQSTPAKQMAASSQTAAAPNPAGATIQSSAAAETPAEAGVEPPEGKMVSFGNLPESRLVFETRLLPGGAGYIRFNEFLDPVSLMPRIEKAIKDYAKAPGIIIDLRGNRGGIGMMAMGIAGFFISENGQKLGEMTTRDTTIKFVIFPRAETYAGPLAILVDAGSASTSEILAQGLRDLGRARIFGTLTAGAALPSDIVRLPNGDGFQFAEAAYVSEKGKVLEGNGVTPDVEVKETRPGHDLAIEAADAWIHSVRR